MQKANVKFFWLDLQPLLPLCTLLYASMLPILRGCPGPVVMCSTTTNVLLLLAGLSSCAQDIHGECQYYQVQFDCTCQDRIITPACFRFYELGSQCLATCNEEKKKKKNNWLQNLYE